MSDTGTEFDSGSNAGEEVLDGEITISTAMLVGIGILSLIALAGVAAVVVRFIAKQSPQWWEIGALCALTFLTLMTALAYAEVIPWRSRALQDWLKPKVLATLGMAVLVTGLGVPLTFAQMIGGDSNNDAPIKEDPAPDVAGLWGETTACRVAYRIEVIGKSLKVARIRGGPAFERFGTINPKDAQTVTFTNRGPGSQGMNVELTLEDDGIARRLLWQEESMENPLRLEECQS